MADVHVALVAHQPGWTADFQTIAAHLRGILAGMALRIDHIGSTAVPGLASKDLIDLQITVESAADLEPAGNLLAAAGYQLRRPTATDHRPPGATGPDSDWQKMFLWNVAGQRRCNIHVRVAGRPNQRYPLLVRDFLRAHPRSAEAYSRLKYLVAPLVPAPAYPDVKDPACDLIYEHARDWAAATAWCPGPSDA